MIPHALLLIIVTPKSVDDSRKLTEGLRMMSIDDPAISSEPHVDPAVVIGANSEEQLETIVDRLARQFQVEAGLSCPYVAYKETVTRSAEGSGRYVRQRAGSGEYAHVQLRIGPRERGDGRSFIDQISAGSIPRHFIAAVGEGVTDALDQGIREGYPVDDVEVVVHDGSYHETDSSESAFKAAAMLAFRDAAQRAQPVLLEPIMRVEVVAPAANMSALLQDLLNRSARIRSRGVDRVEADAPLAQLLGYTSEVRHTTRGAARVTMTFDRYDIVEPRNGDYDGGLGVGVPREPFPRPLRSSAAPME